MERDRRFGKNVANWCSVESEKKGAKDRSLRNTSEERNGVRSMITNGNILRAVSKVRGNEREGCTGETKSGVKSF